MRTPEEERRNRHRHVMLVALNNAAGPTDYRELIPGADMFEMRAAANWLVGRSYAVWAGSGVAITEEGRQLIASLETSERRAPDT